MAAKHNQSHTDDLVGVDLSKLDLDDIQLEPDDFETTTTLWRLTVLLLMIGCAGLILWLPNSDFYRAQGQTNGVFFVLCGAAALFGIASGRWLWQWAEETTRRYAKRHTPVPGVGQRPKKPPSALKRGLTLAGAIGGAGAIVLMAPDSGYIQSGGGDYTGAWFAAAGGAILVGVLAGRFIMMTSERSAQRPPSHPPASLPPWVKWVTLLILVAMGLVALLGAELMPSADTEDTRFALGGIGFVVGILAAIWLAKRFDETERRLHEQTRRHR